MSARAVARGAIVGIAAALAFVVPARANDAAQKMAEKFAGASDSAEARKKEADRKAEEAKKLEALAAEAAAKSEAERKAEGARKKTEAARKAAEAKRRAAAKAAEETRRAAERRSADEAEMLARARREADEMRASAEEARLTEEARRLIEQAERERAKAEELLARDSAAPKPAPAPASAPAPAPAPAQAAAAPEPAQPSPEEQLAYQRSEETRRLVEKLSRVRQIRESRLAGQARREAEEQKAAAAPPQTAPAMPPNAGAPPAASASAAPAPAATPARPPEVLPSPATRLPPSASAPPPAPAQPPTAPPAAIATAPASPPPPAAQAPPTPKSADDPVERKLPEPTPRVAVAPPPSAPLPPTGTPLKSAAGFAPTRVTVLLVMEPGTYGIRRGGAKIADPVLCTREGCYVSAGTDHPAVFLPGRRALGFRNTWGARAGACRNTLGCVFRGVELGVLPGFLQPVDLHLFKHDLRLGHAILADSDCRADAGRLACRHGIYADNYSMWIIPESLAATAGSAALQRALTDRLNGPRSAELAPRR